MNALGVDRTVVVSFRIAPFLCRIGVRIATRYSAIFTSAEQPSREATQLRSIRVCAVVAAFVFVVPIVLLQESHAESCKENCHKKCTIKTKFPPVKFVEPTCHAKCEIAKKAACLAHTDIPDIPVTPLEQVKIVGNAACNTPFEALTKSVIARCSNWDGRIEDQSLINDARSALLDTGLLNSADFKGVTIRWCPIDAEGMAPDRGRVYLHPNLKSDPLSLATTLAHEIRHMRQYRSMGSDDFKCAYSRQYLECGGCQDRRHRLEREAYDFEDRVADALIGAARPGLLAQACQTSRGTCGLSQNAALNEPCECFEPFLKSWDPGNAVIDRQSGGRIARWTDECVISGTRVLIDEYDRIFPYGHREPPIDPGTCVFDIIGGGVRYCVHNNVRGEVLLWDRGRFHPVGQCRPL